MEITAFPEEVTLLIFSFLDAKELSRCSIVCRSWKIAANDDALWKVLLWKKWGDKDPQHFYKEAYKSHFYKEQTEIFQKLTERVLSSSPGEEEQKNYRNQLLLEYNRAKDIGFECLTPLIDFGSIVHGKTARREYITINKTESSIEILIINQSEVPAKVKPTGKVEVKPGEKVSLTIELTPVERTPPQNFHLAGVYYLRRGKTIRNLPFELKFACESPFINTDDLVNYKHIENFGFFELYEGYLYGKKVLYSRVPNYTTLYEWAKRAEILHKTKAIDIALKNITKLYPSPFLLNFVGIQHNSAASYFVMEYEEGIPLENYIQSRHKLTRSERLNIGLQIAKIGEMIKHFTYFFTARMFMMCGNQVKVFAFPFKIWDTNPEEHTTSIYCHSRVLYGTAANIYSFGVVMGVLFAPKLFLGEKLESKKKGSDLTGLLTGIPDSIAKIIKNCLNNFTYLSWEIIVKKLEEEISKE